MRAQCGNVPIFLLSSNSDYTEIYFGLIQMGKNCHFDNFGGFEFSFLGTSHT